MKLNPYFHKQIIFPFCLGIIIWLTLGSDRLLAAILKTWTFDPNTNQLEFTVESEINPKVLLLENPTRIVIDLPNTALGTNNILQDYSGSVKQIRLSQFAEDITRVVIEFNPETTLSQQQITLEKIGKNSTGNRWLLKANIAQTSPSQNLNQPTVTVPPLNRGNQQNSEISVIEFGQPFPQK
jgi:hypothetical protein